MIERRERGIEPPVMIEDCSRAIYIERRAKFLRDARKIDIFAMELAVAVVERMHRYSCSGSRAGCNLFQERATRPPLQFRPPSRQCDQRNDNEQRAKGANNRGARRKIPVERDEQAADAADQ